MAQYEVKIDEQDVASLLFKDEGLKKLVEAILNQILKAQMTEHIGAQTYERSQNRKAYRNGHRVRKLYTGVGPLRLLVPQARDGQFSTSLFKRYQRSEQAFVLALMEMYLNGVSTRKVTKITEKLCGVSFSKSTVSDLCLELDSRVDAWNNRALFEKRYPFIIVDALVIKVRKELGVVPISTLITIGITTEGYREIIVIHLGDSESEATWRETFEQLKSRGLKGVDYVISDNHFGLVKALKRNFQGVCWQRCQVHFQRNVLSATPRKYRDGIAHILKKILKVDNQNEKMKLEKYSLNYLILSSKKVPKLQISLKEV
jgi:putative transposase